MKYDHIHSMLRSLARQDMDAIHCYDHVIEHIKDDQDLHHDLLHCRSEHERHVTDINDAIRRYGGEPFETARDFKDLVHEGITALKTIGGRTAALKTIHSQENKLQEKYQEALATESLPLDIRALLERHYGDECRHGEFTESMLEGESSRSTRPVDQSYMTTPRQPHDGGFDGRPL